VKNSHLNQVPEGIINLKNLVHISLHNNELICLPREMSLLPNLESIDISHNELIDLPPFDPRVKVINFVKQDNLVIGQVSNANHGPASIWAGPSLVIDRRNLTMPN